MSKHYYVTVKNKPIIAEDTHLGDGCRIDLNVASTPIKGLLRQAYLDDPMSIEATKEAIHYLFYEEPFSGEHDLNEES